MSCDKEAMLHLLSAFQGWNLSHLLPCDMTQISNTTFYPHDAIATPNHKAYNFYAVITPLIIVIGLCGNLISLRVFTSTRLRKLSASLYLAALSASDSMVLLTYVLFDWLLRGLPYWTGSHNLDFINKNGLCHVFLFSSYTFRFISVYLLLIFTVERYIAVCQPLRRRILCTKTFARRVIISVVVLGMTVSIYKPIVSGMYPVAASHLENIFNNTFLYSNSNHSGLYSSRDSGIHICTNNPQFGKAIFTLELIYGLTITAFPFVIVCIFNILLLRKLINRQLMASNFFSLIRKSRIRIEFTVMVIAVSTCFVCLNIPYLIVWIKQNLHTSTEVDPDVIQTNSDYLRITRTIFNLNYCINFFVYCLTGSYYRGIMQRMFLCLHRTPKRSGSHLISVRQSSTDIFLSNIQRTRPYTAHPSSKGSDATEEELFVKKP